MFSTFTNFFWSEPDSAEGTSSGRKASSSPESVPEESFENVRYEDVDSSSDVDTRDWVLVDEPLRTGTYIQGRGLERVCESCHMYLGDLPRPRPEFDGLLRFKRDNFSPPLRSLAIECTASSSPFAGFVYIPPRRKAEPKKPGDDKHHVRRTRDALRERLFGDDAKTAAVVEKSTNLVQYIKAVSPVQKLERERGESHLKHKQLERSNVSRQVAAMARRRPRRREFMAPGRFSRAVNNRKC